jgi:hypothetical protein
MPKRRVAAPSSTLPSQRCTEEACLIASHLQTKHNAKQWQVKLLLGMLDEHYILSLPRLKRDTAAADDTSPTHLHWLLYT